MLYRIDRNLTIRLKPLSHSPPLSTPSTPQAIACLRMLSQHRPDNHEGDCRRKIRWVRWLERKKKRERQRKRETKNREQVLALASKNYCCFIIKARIKK